MHNIKFETRDYKLILKIDEREVCLSSDTPEDDDIKDIIIKALEAYHEYQGDKLKHYMDYYYLLWDINSKEYNKFINKQHNAAENNDFQKPQRVVIVSDGIYNLDRGVIIGFDGEEVLVNVDGYHTQNFDKASLHIDDIDSRIKKGASVIFNGEYGTIEEIKLIDKKLVYDLNVNEKLITVQSNELVFAEIDETEKGVFVQINDSGKDYDRWYGCIQHKIKQIDSYVVNIQHNDQNIVIKSKDIVEIDIKNNNKDSIQVNDMIKTVSCDGRMIFDHRYGIVRCHTGREYYIDFGNALHHYKQERFSKVNISKDINTKEDVNKKPNPNLIAPAYDLVSEG
jgi:hypothetical protein